MGGLTGCLAGDGAGIEGCNSVVSAAPALGPSAERKGSSTLVVFVGLRPTLVWGGPLALEPVVALAQGPCGPRVVRDAGP